MKIPAIFIILGFAVNLHALVCWFPKIQLDTLAPGVVQVKTCGNSDCSNFTIDTVSEQGLLDTLAFKYNSYNYCAIVHISDYKTGVDSGGCVQDSVTGQIICRDYWAPESVLVVFDNLLKGQMPIDRLWYATPRVGWGDSYFSLKDMTFLTFFNAYDSIGQLGFNPRWGCDLEATGYFIENNRISATGDYGMPGISVSFPDFRKTISVENAAEKADLGFSMHPNPARGTVTISFTGSNADLKIFDLRGRLVANLSPAATQGSGGISRSEWNAGGLPNGIYLLKARVDNRTVAKRLFLQK